MRAKSRKAAGQCAWRIELPYGYAAAMPGLHERAMDRRGDLPDLRGRRTEERSALPKGGTGG